MLPCLRWSSTKNVYVAYFFWIWLGAFGIHHIYLNRDKQALLYWCTFGGGLLGWFRDLWRIPEYVQDANNDRYYLASLAYKMRSHKKPPLSLARVGAQLGLALLWSAQIMAALPINDYNVFWLVYVLVPLASALAVYTVGNIGREQGDLKPALIGAYLGVPFLLYKPDSTGWVIVASTFAFNYYSKRWRRKIRPRQSCCRRAVVIGLCILLNSAVWASFLYFNATITDNYGESIKLRDAVTNFFKSAMWKEFSDSLVVLYNFYKHHGFKKAWEHVIETADPLGEKDALKTLELGDSATQEEIQMRWKKLSREWHPDRFRDKDKKREAQDKFIEFKAAYETLSDIHSRRQKKNKVDRED